MNLIVSEIFGPTIQGEGRHTGQNAIFLRLGGCNLSCSWCDTPYTWAFGEIAQSHRDKRAYSREAELTAMTVDEVLDDLDRRILPLSGPLLVLTGGEPMLQKTKLETMMESLSARFRRGIDVETAGTIAPFAYSHIYYTVSPKLKSSGNQQSKRRKLDVLSQYAELAEQGRADFKFVIVSDEDLEEVLELQESVCIPRGNIWLMPEGISAEVISAGLQKIAPIALEYGFNISTRLQIDIWGNKRGV